METADGAMLRSGEWKGKVVPLDFWRLGAVTALRGSKPKQMHEEFAPTLQVTSINTDEPSAIAAAAPGEPDVEPRFAAASRSSFRRATILPLLPLFGR